MILLNLPGKFIKLIRCDNSKQIPNIVVSILEKFYGKNIDGLRMDIYSNPRDTWVLIADYKSMNILITRIDYIEQDLYDLSDMNYNELWNKIIKTIGDDCYIELYELKSNEIDTILLIISEKAKKDLIKQPFIKYSIKSLISGKGKDISEHSKPALNYTDRDNFESFIFGKLCRFINPEYSKELATPVGIAGILAFSKKYHIFSLSNNPDKLYKIVEFLEIFLTSNNIWAIQLRFAENEIWIAKKNKKELGIFIKYGNKKIIDIEDCRNKLNEIINQINKYKNIDIILYEI